MASQDPSQISSSSSSSVSPSQRRQVVYGPGVTQSQSQSQRRQSQSQSQQKKKSTPNAAAAAATTKKKKQPTGKKIIFPDMPDIDVNTIYWVVPSPGYGNPLNLSSIPENTGKIFTRWLSWEREDRVGYTLWDKYDAKYWADAASIHMLSKATLAGITYEYFFYTVYRDRNGLKYGFIPKSYIPREQLTAFESFKAENQKLVVPGGYIEKSIVIKDDEDNETEEDSISSTISAAGNNEEMDEEMDDGFKL